MNNQRLKKLVETLEEDTAIIKETKIEMLVNWLDSIVTENSGRFMDKEAAAEYAESLSIVDKALANLRR